MWKFIVILNLHLVLGSTDFMDGPRNMVVISGQTMKMECRADSNSTVSEWSLFTSTKKTIFVNSKGQKKIKNEHFGIVEGTHGSVALYTNSTEMDDAGTYTCAVQKTLKQPDRYSAQLIVFEREPFCETNLSTTENNTFEEGTYIWMQCTVNFTGNWTPTLEWRLHEGNGETDEEPRDLTEWANVVIVPNVNVSSTLTIALNATSNSSYYSCRIYFPSLSRSDLMSADNTPDYSYRWSSPLVATLPKTVIPRTQWKGMTIDDSANNGNDLKSTFNAFNAIYLVAGVAVLFGIASSLVALTLCLRLRRKNSAARESGEVLEGQYDLIPYACTDGYDTIEEVEERDDILVTDFPPRHGSLPTPGYTGFMADVPKPPGVYTRMDQKTKSAEDNESDVDWYEQPTNPESSTPDQSKPPDTEDSTRINSYPDLETNACNDIAVDGDKSLRSESDNNVVETTGEEDASRNRALDSNSYLELLTQRDKEIGEDGYEIPSDYLKVREDSLQSNSDNNVYETMQKEDSSTKPILDSNTYAELATKNNKEIAEESGEIPSDYLQMTDDSLHSISDNNVYQRMESKTEAENQYLIPTAMLKL